MKIEPREVVDRQDQLAALVFQVARGFAAGEVRQAMQMVFCDGGVLAIQSVQK